jgi:hypothetical protein
MCGAPGSSIGSTVYSKPMAIVFAHDRFDGSFNIFLCEFFHEKDRFAKEIVYAFVVHAAVDIVGCGNDKRKLMPVVKDNMNTSML